VARADSCDQWGGFGAREHIFKISHTKSRKKKSLSGVKVRAACAPLHRPSWVYKREKKENEYSWSSTVRTLCNKATAQQRSSPGELGRDVWLWLGTLTGL